MVLWCLLDDAIKARLDKEVNSEQVVLFMKGTPESPQCGFSMAVSNVLKHLNVKFKGVNVLEDQNLRHHNPMIIIHFLKYMEG